MAKCGSSFVIPAAIFPCVHGRNDLVVAAGIFPCVHGRNELVAAAGITSTTNEPPTGHTPASIVYVAQMNFTLESVLLKA